MYKYSGVPYWIAKNGLNNYTNPLQSDHATYVAIIGAGITGALVAHELCSAGIKCALIDKNVLSRESTANSTSILQYEIDKPLSELVKIMKEENAVLVYESTLKAISDIEQVFQKVRFDPDFEKVSGISYADDDESFSFITTEYEIRKKHGLPINLLNKSHLYEKYGINAFGALENNSSAQLDVYKAATHLIDYHMDKNGLEVFTHTEITEYIKNEHNITLKTSNGFTISCKYIVFAVGYESDKFSPQINIELASVYAIISKPLEENFLWDHRLVLRSAKQSYFSVRTDNDKRIIASGEEEKFNNEQDRDKYLPHKTKLLKKKINNLFPKIHFDTDMAWYGTISYTKDRLPCIGSFPNENHIFHAFGYGRNGIIYGMIAAQMISNKIIGIKDKREAVFGFTKERNLLFK